MQQQLDQNPLILIEASIVERIRRAGRVTLDPSLVHAPLIYDESGRRELRTIYEGYVEIAKAAGLPLLICTPTWRANRQRVEASGIDSGVNENAVRFLRDIRDAASVPDVLVGGLIGVKNDCYRPDEGLRREEARRFHAWQVERLAGAGSDFLIVETIPALDEGIGIALAMAETGLPYVVSFVIDRAGRLLDGTDLASAVDVIDREVLRKPVGYMVNCSYPSFLCAERQPAALFDRLIGYQANASALNHRDLDGAERLEAEPVEVWGDAMLELNRRWGLKILGGCCGTGPEHLRYLARGGTGEAN